MARPREASTAGSESAASGTPTSLLERVKANDAAAWRQFVDLYSPLVFHWCRRDGLAEADVPDVAQDVFFAVSSHLSGFRKERRGDTFRGWLRTVCRNKVRDAFRRRHPVEPAGAGGSEAQSRLAGLASPVPDDEQDPESHSLERQLFRRSLALVRDEFEGRTWRAFWRSAVDGVPTAEVADELGMTPGAVRVAKSRVLHRLRETLGDLAD